MRQKFKFKGWDWTELSECFGIDHLNEEDKIVLEQTKDYLLKSCGTPNQKEVANDIRRFLRKLIGWSSFSNPVWQGLLNIPHKGEDREGGDETLIKFTVELLGCMWN